MKNLVILIGNLGADPEVRYMPSGGAVTSIRLATTMRWKDRNTGERKDSTEWHRVVFFNRLAEVAGEYLKKGSQVYLEGRLQTRKWQDQSGQDRYTTEIIASEMHMLGVRGAGGDQSADNSTATYNGGKQSAPGAQAGYADSGNMPPPENYDDFDDDIPF